MSRQSFRFIRLPIFCCAMAATLAAQTEPAKTHTTGLLLGIGAEANVVSTQPGSTSSTNAHVQGKGIVLGYGLTPAWALYLNAGWGEFLTSGGNTTRAGSVDFGTRYHFRPRGSVFVPFLQGGISNHTFSRDVPRSTGTTSVNVMSYRYLPALGGGMNAYVAPSMALSGSATWSATAGGLASPRMHLGLLLSPGAWRAR